MLRKVESHRSPLNRFKIVVSASEKAREHPSKILQSKMAIKFITLSVQTANFLHNRILIFFKKEDPMETNSINSFLVLITGDIDNFMYTYILVALLVFTGIYFTIRTKGVQFRYIKDMFTQLFEKKVDKNGKAISSFQAMMVSTGSRVGTGNIAGIATALAMGGPGALFWMWVMALIGGASAIIESTLAQIFKIRGKDGQFRGGPAYYIQQGLGKRWMGIVFAVSLIACYVVGFNELQAYNAASGLEYYIPDYATNGAAVVLGVVFTIATAAVIFGGQKRISVINSWVVPIMALAYIGLGVI